MNISLHMKKKQQQQQQQQLHYHHMTDFDEIDTYILNKSNQQLQIVEYINDKNGLSLSKIVSSTHILIAAIKRGYLIHKEYVFNTFNGNNIQKIVVGCFGPLSLGENDYGEILNTPKKIGEM